MVVTAWILMVSTDIHVIRSLFVLQQFSTINRQESSTKSSQIFLYYLENIWPHFVTTNQGETCADYGPNLEVNDQIECRQAFPVANGQMGVTYRHLDRSMILIKDDGTGDNTRPGGCHVMAQANENRLEFNPDLGGSSHPDAWQVCKSCKYQYNRNS